MINYKARKHKQVILTAVLAKITYFFQNLVSERPTHLKLHEVAVKVIN